MSTPLCLGCFRPSKTLPLNARMWAGPGVAPGGAGNNSLPLPLPSGPGAYEIRYEVAVSLTCEDAVSRFYQLNPGPERTLVELTIE